MNDSSRPGSMPSPEAIETRATFACTIEKLAGGDQQVLLRTETPLSDRPFSAAIIETSALVLHLAEQLPNAAGALLIEIPADEDVPPRILISVEKEQFDSLMEIVKQAVLLLFETEGLRECEHVEIVAEIRLPSGKVDLKASEHFAFAAGGSWFVNRSGVQFFAQFSIWKPSVGKFETFGEPLEE